MKPEEGRWSAEVDRLLGVFGIGTLWVGHRIVDDEAMQELNRTWRGIDRSTDVLSFAAHDGEIMLGTEDELGDLVISLETASRQASERGHDLKTEMAVLVAHGLLHLCGWDHEADTNQARAMAELELSLLDLADVELKSALIGRALP